MSKYITLRSLTISFQLGAWLAISVAAPSGALLALSLGVALGVAARWLPWLDGLVDLWLLWSDRLWLLLAVLLLAVLVGWLLLLLLWLLNRVSIFLSPVAVAAGGLPLGIHAELSTTCEVDIARQEGLKRRFSLQTYARALLGSDWRIWHCLRTPIISGVGVSYRQDVARASLSGLQHCGSPHVCPVCAAAISHQRVGEIDAGIRVHQAAGGAVLFSTFTLQHTADESLVVVGERLRGAWSDIKEGNRWSLFKQRYGVIGQITSTEYTFGKLGWHPHLHVLFFVRSAANRGELAAWLSSRWASVVARHGGYAHHLIGCSTRWGDAALAEYVTKQGWSLGDEVARANRKQSRSAGGMTPAMLLAAGAAGDERAAELFVEYAVYTFRLDSLRWSRGLRARLGLQREQSDAELAAGDSLGASVVLILTNGQWRAVLASPDVERADLLLAAEKFKGSGQQLAAWLEAHGFDIDAWQVEPDRLMLPRLLPVQA